MEQSTEPLPTIRLMLGDDLKRVERQSTYNFPRKELGKIDIIAADKPFIFGYTRPGCDFILPPGRSFGAAMTEGYAVSITVSPQLRYMSLAESLNVLDDIQARLRASTWTLARRRAGSDEIRGQLALQRDSQVTMSVEDWRCGEDEVYIELARHWGKGESLPQLAGRPHDLLVVSIKIENDAVRSRYSGR